MARREPLLVSAPAKTIVVGEHVVVHGRTALAAAVSLRTYVLLEDADLVFNSGELHCFPASAHLLISDGMLRVHFPSARVPSEFAWPLASLPCIDAASTTAASEVHFAPTLLSQVERVLAPDTAALGVFAMAASSLLCLLAHSSASCASPLRGLRVRVCSQVPLGVGLGSSAAYNTAIAFALLAWHGRVQPDAEGTLTGEDAALVNAHAFAAERLMHGTPSGIDNAASLHGGLLAFTAGVIEPLQSARSLRVLITNTRVSRNTKALVASVRALLESHPLVATPLLDSVHALAQRVRALWCDAALESAAVEAELRVLLRVNHGVLNALGVGHVALERVVAITQAHGFTSKLTGAGGGGCALTLVPSDARDDTVAACRAELEAAGFDCLDVRLGERGAHVHVGVHAMPELSDFRST